MYMMVIVSSSWLANPAMVSAIASCFGITLGDPVLVNTASCDGDSGDGVRGTMIT